MSAIPLSTTETVEEPVSLWRDAWYRLKRNRLAIFGLVIVLILGFTAIFGPYLTPYDYLSQDLNARNVLPSMSHLFGTDDLGRDVFSRVVFGTRTAFLVAIIVTVFAVLIGLVLGAVAGFFGNPFDRAIMVYKVYQDGFVQLDLGSSAAQSVLLMFIAILFTIVQFRALERKVNYQV